MTPGPAVQTRTAGKSPYDHHLLRKRFSEPELYRLSRDTGVLARMAILTGAVFVIIAFICSATGPATERHQTATQLGDAGEAKISPRALLGVLRRTLVNWRAERNQAHDIGTFPLHVILERIEEPGLQELFTAYAEAALNAVDAGQNLPFLQSRAMESPPPLLANEMLGDLYQWQGQKAKAAEHYQIEARYPDAHYARQQLMIHLIEAKDREALADLMRNPDYALDHHHHWLKLGVIMKDPGFILRGVILHDYGELPFIVWLLTVPVTFLWFWILKKICFVPSWKSKTIALSAAGILLGILSTTATLFAVVWQEEVWGFELNGDFTNDFMVYVLGVGVREETIKFLFFLPLVPWLYRIRDPRAVLLVASCVGLGFAVQENIGYFHRFGATLSRFVTANFFHIILTGTLGFAFCRFLYTPRKEWNRFLATYIVVILVHGIYDFLITLPDGTFFAILLFCCSAYFYFDLVEKHCSPIRQIISPLSVFVIGSAIIFGCSLVATSVTTPSFHAALSRSGGELLSVVPLMFIYINRFRHA